MLVIEFNLRSYFRKNVMHILCNVQFINISSLQISSYPPRGQCSVDVALEGFIAVNKSVGRYMMHTGELDSDAASRMTVRRLLCTWWCSHMTGRALLLGQSDEITLQVRSMEILRRL